MASRLDGKTALVTGAGRGIGRAIAQRLARDGARVLVNYSRSKTEAESLVEAIQAAGGQALALQADVADLAQIARMFDAIKAETRQLDILVNNAGRGIGKGVPTLEGSTPENFETVFGLNTRGLFFTAQHAARMMPEGGRIVNVSSTSTVVRVAGLSLYSGSKAAVEAFTRSWAVELAPRQITVNAVLPGMVDTDLITDNMPPGAREAAAKRHPRGRIGQPDDIADAVAFLCGEDARWISGEHIICNGGG